MKKLIAIILINISLFLCFSVTTETASFTVRAYKVGSSDVEYIDMGVYDALTGTLKSVTSGSTIHLTPYTNDLKTTASSFSSSSLEPYDEHVIFSFRVSGNNTGSFTCNVSISPLKKEKNVSTDPDEIIKAYYELRDTTCVFTTNYKTTGKNGGTTSISSGATTSMTVNSSSGTLSSSWTVNTSSLENWRFQGSVGMAIMTSDYSSASNGVYKANVTISLVVNK